MLIPWPTATSSSTGSQSPWLPVPLGLVLGGHHGQEQKATDFYNFRMAAVLVPLLDESAIASPPLGKLPCIFAKFILCQDKVFCSDKPGIEETLLEAELSSLPPCLCPPPFSPDTVLMTHFQSGSLKISLKTLMFEMILISLTSW